MTSSTGLLDTSVIVAQENHRPFDAARLPDRQVISVVTLAELRAGVLAARDASRR